jgi:hypothetical protein
MGNFNDVLKYNYKLRDGHEIVAIMNGGKEALLSIPDSIAIIHAKEPHEYVQGVFNPSLNSLAIKNLEDYIKREGSGIKSIVWKDGVSAEVKLNLKKGSSSGDTIQLFTDLEGVSQVMGDYLLEDCAGYDKTGHLAKVLSRVENLLYHHRIQFSDTEKLCDVLRMGDSRSFWERFMKKGGIKESTFNHPTTYYLVKEALKNKGNTEQDFFDLVTSDMEETFLLPLAYSPHKRVKVTNGSHSGLTFEKEANAAIAIWENEDGRDSFSFENSIGGEAGYWRWFRSISLKVNEVV